MVISFKAASKRYVVDKDNYLLELPADMLFSQPGEGWYGRKGRAVAMEQLSSQCWIEIGAVLPFDRLGN